MAKRKGASSKANGVVYILTNPSFPEYVKIGYANDIEKRLKQLNRSETIPFAFRVYAVYQVGESLTDTKLHTLIDTINPDLRTIETFDGKKRVKEFYAMSAEDAYRLLECIATISGTTDRLKRLTPEGHEIKDQQTAEEVRKTAKRGPFRFSDCNIQPGSEIVFIDDESVRPVVIDDRHIEYEGRTTSMSALAQQLKGFASSVQGTIWFTYQGEKLADIRDRMEKEKE